MHEDESSITNEIHTERKEDRKKNRKKLTNEIISVTNVKYL